MKEPVLTTETAVKHLVAIIGAGPAGLFAAKELAAGGVEVVVFNRDVKPGGLAEYGIYHDKHIMKNGLRKQFRKLLDEPRIHYYGNVTVGKNADISLDALQKMGFQAILVTVGAQGTKWLGLPGEDLKGVYHAKDLVYHYNDLPPYSEQSFPIGRRVVCIGVGNVMLDIANWTIRDLKLDEVVAVARRGPADVKFTKKEMEIVARNLDLAAMDKEFERVAPVMQAIGEDVQAAKDFILSALKNAEEPVSDTVFRFEFLASPVRIVGDDRSNVTGLEVEDTTLEARLGGGSNAVGLGTMRVIPCDTVVFCIGDRVDDSFGLPLDKWKEFAKSPEPRFPIEGLSFEAYDPQTGQPIEGVFLAGWAREASSGLVGTARKDGTNGAKAVEEYLRTLPPIQDVESVLRSLKDRLNKLPEPAVDKALWEKLDLFEQKKMQELNLPYFKFATNDEMFRAIGLDGTGPRK